MPPPAACRGRRGKSCRRSTAASRCCTVPATLPLPDPGQQHRAALRRRGGTRRLPVERAAQDHAQGGVAGLDPAAGDDRAPTLSPAFHGGRAGQSHGCPRALFGATVYRIHGTNAPETIGHAVSSGCFRLVNEQVIDLYQQVSVGTKVVVQNSLRTSIRALPGLSPVARHAFAGAGHAQPPAIGSQFG